MIKHIKARKFKNIIDLELSLLPVDSVIKSIGTNQTHFIIYAEDTNGKEHKIYIPCEEDQIV